MLGNFSYHNPTKLISARILWDILKANSIDTAGTYCLYTEAAL